MSTGLSNDFDKVFITTHHDKMNGWVYNNWVGYQTYVGIVAGADNCLHLIRAHACPYLLNDNREVLGTWDHTVEWIVTNWAPRAIEAGLTHFANVVSHESMAAQSAEAMRLGIEGQLHMRMFGDMAEAQDWLREAQAKRAGAARVRGGVVQFDAKQ
jgi:hypothetical protein